MLNGSKETMNGLTEFLLCEVDTKVLQGISYILVKKGKTNEKLIAKYDGLRHSMNEEGIHPKVGLRRYELDNGIIYDLELDEAIRLTELISRAVAKNNNGETPVGDLGIREKAMERHRQDMERLTDKIVNSAKKGMGKIEVALFSKNMTNNIVITGKDAKNAKREVAITYDAYALRHTDIEELNREYLALYGLMVTKVEVHEMLPSSTGVRFTLTLAKVSF